MAKQNRAARSVYATSRDGKTLYRFDNTAHRQDYIESDRVVPIDALEFRDRVMSDSEKDRLHIADLRGKPSRSRSARASASTTETAQEPVSPETGSGQAPQGEKTAETSEDHTQAAPVAEPKGAEPKGIDAAALGRAVVDAMRPFLAQMVEQQAPGEGQPRANRLTANH